jgi:hypothetical protein
VSKYINELIAIGAITKDQKRDERNMRTRNVYTVNFEPAPGLATPAKFSDFYHQRTETVRRRLIAARQDVVRSGALPAPDDAQVETIDAGQDVVCSNALRSVPQHPDVLRPTAPEQDQEVQQEEVGSKSFSRDKSLEIYTHARDQDHLGVEARGRPDEGAEVLGVHEQDLFGGDQLPVSNGKIKKPAQRDAEFDAFWRIYPKRVGKIDARRAWDRALTRVELGRLMAGAETYVRYIQGDPWRKQFTKDPATWLNKGCWDDELDFGPPNRNGHQKTIPPRVSATDRAVDEVRTAFRELRESGGQLGLPGGPR